MPLLTRFTKKQSDAENESSSQLYRLSGMGIELAASVAGMVLVGWLLDWACGTKPWLLVTFAVLGIIGGTYNFIKAAVRENRRTQARWRRTHPAAPTTPTAPTTIDAEGDDQERRGPPDSDTSMRNADHSPEEVS